MAADTAPEAAAEEAPEAAAEAAVKAKATAVQPTWKRKHQTGKMS